MEKVEAVRLALAELGEASDEAVTPKFVPVLRAMLKEREMMTAFRQKQAAEKGGIAAA